MERLQVAAICGHVFRLRDVSSKYHKKDSCCNPSSRGVGNPRETEEEGCPSCSFWADNFEGIDIHLNHRDINLVVISRARLETLEAYKKRMGWSFKWVSSFGNDFNRDYHVSFAPEEMEKGEVIYNYSLGTFPSEEAPGISVFFKNEQGEVFYTYSCYARGLDMLNGAYHYMDLAPKGRDEEGLPYTMAWLRRHDQYDD